MKKRNFLAMGFTVIMVTLMSVSAWAVPQLINYQGKLSDSAGDPLDGTYDVTFYLYTVDSGGGSIWDESQSVTLADGLYSVQLGTDNPPFPAGLFDNESLYLEVAIYNPDTSSWETLSPRQRLTSVAYAMKAESVVDGAVNTAMIAEGAVTSSKIQDGATLAEIIDNDGTGSGLDADLLDGLSASAFATVGHSHDSRYYTKAEVDSLVSSFESRIAQLEYLLENVSRNQNDITISGMNVHITNGTGTTDGMVNSFGNLIVGYNELRGSGDLRTGSHNIVVGKLQNYSSYGGLVAGYRNTISREYASVSGGGHNTANGFSASVSGGYRNTADDNYTSVSGGQDNTASGPSASVSGGEDNTASGPSASVSGGNYNTASSNYSSVSGGNYNTASGESSSVSGGYYNTVSGDAASVSGGARNKAAGYASSVAGGGGYNEAEGNVAFAHYSAILGGAYNKTGDPDLLDNYIGWNSCVSGGLINTASGEYSTISGGYYNTADGERSSVSGGADNTAGAFCSSVSGGYYNTASGDGSSVSGGGSNTASGDGSSVSGGIYNTAAGYASSVTGGGGDTEAEGNVAFADYSAILGGKKNRTGDPNGIYHYLGSNSTISGGRYNTAAGECASVTGGGGDTLAEGNIAFADYSAILGGIKNRAGDPDGIDRSIGINSSVSGGGQNTASNDYASVNGGWNNKASGVSASVCGGFSNTASGDDSTIAGGSTNTAGFLRSSVSCGYSLSTSSDFDCVDQ